MESLQIRTGAKSLQILDDSGNERGIFTFNPTDIESAKKMFTIRQELMEKEQEYAERAEQCQTEEESFDLLIEVVDYFKEKIDDCFGAGTSELLFGDNKSLSMFSDFFTGIAPYYAKASEDRKAKYAKK